MANFIATLSKLTSLTDYSYYDLKSLEFRQKNNSCIRITQENSIEFLVQSSLPYILLLMVRAHYCAPYPK